MRMAGSIAGAALLASGWLCGGCASNSEPHGSPVLTMVTWTAAGVRSVVWSASDASVAAAAPPGATEVDFVFDRRLDGDRIENPKATPPITVDWPNQSSLLGDPPFTDQVLYNSEPLYGDQTSYALLQPALPGFPSGTTVSFQLDHAGLTSAYGDQMFGPTRIDVPVDAFTAAFQWPVGDAGATVTSNFNIPILFSNRTEQLSRLAPHVTAQVGGAPLPIVVSGDGANPAIVYASPAACLGGWPSGVPITISVDDTASDGFGVEMAAAASATFTATGGSSPTPDGGACVDAATP
jgi:hypothetical protein